MELAQQLSGFFHHRLQRRPAGWFFNAAPYMKYYLLRRGQEFVVHTVRDEFLHSFLGRYGQEILLEADSLMGLLALFAAEWLLEVEWRG